MLGQIHSSVIERFKALGAVKAGCCQIRRYRHSDEMVPFPDIVYFFDAENREIGYWTVLTPFNENEPIIFAPHYRTWDPAIFNNMYFRSLEHWA
jgi:hypothetical protein